MKNKPTHGNEGNKHAFKTVKSNKRMSFRITESDQKAWLRQAAKEDFDVLSNWMKSVISKYLKEEKAKASRRLASKAKKNA